MNGNEVKTLADGAALTVTLSGVMGWMTPVATLVGSLLGIVWMGIRIYETETVKALIAKYAKHE
tara:strand:- start:352 stop:543 length:192 start_codon:yes stop_codon:yes gene_type:complete